MEWKRKMLEFMVAVGLILVMSTTRAGKICDSMILGKMLPGNHITMLTTSGKVLCAKSCLTRRKCKSVNFKSKFGECHLKNKAVDSASSELIADPDFVFLNISSWPENLLGVCANHTCPLNSYCDPVNTTQHVCKVTGCLGSPTVENGHFSTAPEEGLAGDILTLLCDRGIMPQGEAVCQDNGTWSSPECVSVSSCSMVKQYPPDSEDGEYWLRLINFDNYTTRIYCHNMSKSSPQEFLTLLNINYGIYPMVMNEVCNGETELRLGCTGQGGEVWFSKIRVNIITMGVSSSDRTFANISHDWQYMEYGTAYDCYTYRFDNCGVEIKGRFTIDLRETGWRVKEGQEWKKFGYKPNEIGKMERVDEVEGRLITLKCGGWSGGCRPEGGLFLTPFL